MKLKTLGDREITFKIYTRGMSRQVNEKLMEGVILNTDGGTNQANFPAVNGDKSNELKISLITGLSHDELDSLTVEEYDELVKAVEVDIKKNSAMK